MLRSILMREEESPYTNNLPRHHSLGRDFAVRRGASDRWVPRLLGSDY